MLEPLVMQVNSVVEELKPMLRRLLPEHLDSILELEPELGNMRMDPGQMEQVIVNLACATSSSFSSSPRQRARERGWPYTPIVCS